MTATHSLLTLAARISGDAAYYQQLAQTSQSLASWADVPKQAEWHGLGPLLYRHLRAAGIQLQPEIKGQLQGLYLRHRRANRVRANALVEILGAYQAAGLQVLVLKGAALAQLLYPEPGLRPMSDIDLLVRKADVYEAGRLLAGLGFETHLPGPDNLPDKHLLVAVRQTDGLPVSVEVHHKLLAKGHAQATSLEDLSDDLFPFPLQELTAYTLGYEAMLWHLCQHIAHHTNVWAATRLIWVADIVGFAERFATQIDWSIVADQFPRVLNTLSLFHFISPLADALRQQAPLKIGGPPQDIELNFQGWPHSSLAQQRQKGYRRILYDTFYPPEGWLRLRYGLNSASPLFWQRWVRHPLHILGWGAYLLAGRLGWRRA